MHSSMCPTVHGLGFVHCGQIAWKKWPTNWHAHVSRWLMLSCHWQLWVLLPMCLFDCLLVFSFVGRWLLPSLVDTGDICCHYWQHILVYFVTDLYMWRSHITNKNILDTTLILYNPCPVSRGPMNRFLQVGLMIADSMKPQVVKMFWQG